MGYSKLVMEPALVQPPKLPEADEPAGGPPVPVQPPISQQNPAQADLTNLSHVQVHNSDKHEGLRSILTTLAILILAPLIAFALTAFIFQSYQVDGSSMETTLQNQDRLIVLKLPRTWS